MPARARVTSQVPRLDDKVVAQLVDVVVRLRELELKKAPSIAESVDWAHTLIALQIGDLDETTVARTLGERRRAQGGPDHRRSRRCGRAGGRRRLGGRGGGGTGQMSAVAVVAGYGTDDPPAAEGQSRHGRPPWLRPGYLSGAPTGATLTAAGLAPW